MPLPSRRPTPPRRPVRHPAPRSSPGSFTQTGSAGFGGPATNGVKPTPTVKPTPGGPSGSWAGLTPGTNGQAVLPVDPIYEAQAGVGGTIDRTTSNTVAGLTGERDRTLLDYGYNVQYDAEGNPLTDTLTFDPSNVFSRAAQLRKRWMEARSGTRNGMAAQGQMNSGAYGRAQRQNNYGESAQTDAEMKGLLSFLARNGSQIAGAKIAGEEAKGVAEGERITRAPSLPGYVPSGPPMAPGGAGIANYNDRGYKTKIVRGKNGELHIYPDGRRVFVRYK